VAADPDWPPPSDEAPADAEQAPASAGGSWWAGFLLGLSLLLAVSAVAAIALVLAAGAPPRAVLVFGVDERPDEQQRGQYGHTDTMAALLFPRSGGAVLVSLPRDLWVDIPDYGPQRLNVAYPLGAQDGGPAAGAALLGRTLESEFGLAVNRWVRVDFQGFVALIDALGGVEIDVPRPIVDEHYPTADYGTRRLVIPAGRPRLDGEDALAYVRTRALDSDFGRMARQQQVLLALRDQALSPAGLLRLPAAALALPGVLQTNLGPAEALAAARTLAVLPREELHTLVVGPELAPPRVGPGGAAILVPRTAAIRQALADALQGRPIGDQ
jgi:LCP family protein required for cell wall assembly